MEFFSWHVWGIIWTIVYDNNVNRINFVLLVWAKVSFSVAFYFSCSIWFTILLKRVESTRLDPAQDGMFSDFRLFLVDEKITFYKIIIIAIIRLLKVSSKIFFKSSSVSSSSPRGSFTLYSWYTLTHCRKLYITCVDIKSFSTFFSKCSDQPWH